MQTPDFRRFFQCTAFAAAVAIASAATPTIVSAQAVDSTTAAMNRVDTNTDDDDGMDLGWLGLLGLAGLLGLRRRDNHTVHHTDTTARRP